MACLLDVVFTPSAVTYCPACINCCLRTMQVEPCDECAPRACPNTFDLGLYNVVTSMGCVFLCAGINVLSPAIPNACRTATTSGICTAGASRCLRESWPDWSRAVPLVLVNQKLKEIELFLSPQKVHGYFWGSCLESRHAIGRKCSVEVPAGQGLHGTASCRKTRANSRGAWQLLERQLHAALNGHRPRPHGVKVAAKCPKVPRL